MFTGIIEGLGTVSGIRSDRQGKRFTIDADFRLDGTRIGDSISVSGACLTVVKLDGPRFETDVSPETLEKTTFGQLKIGNRVNLERALRLSDRIDGHLVSGHIDGTGVISQRENLGNAIVVTIEVPEALARYMIAKGSVAADGISLTINTCSSNSFSVSIIPHTAKLTTIGFKEKGARVNIETDMIGKYVARFTGAASPATGQNETSAPGIDKDFLVKTGFL